MNAQPSFRFEIIAGLVALLLTACGGSDSTTSGSTGAPVSVSGSLTGVFSDGPVQGLTYSTTSGVTGTTDAQGRFAYNAGDTVTFRLGALSLGSSSASSLVTPLSLAAGDATRLQNTLVLLQSLDSDGLPGNGITIPAAAASAVSAGLSLTQPSATFASSANTALTAAMTAGGISRTVTSLASANEHFSTEGRKHLSRGIWMTSDGTAMVRFSQDGTYHLASREETSKCGTGNTEGPICGPTVVSQSGVEFGPYVVESIGGDGYKIRFSPSIDTNVQGGFSHPASCDGGIIVNGDTLVANSTCFGGPTRLQLVVDRPGTIVGVWALGSASQLNTQHFTFFADGRYMMWDPVGDSQGNNPGITGGIEYGTYTYVPATGALTASVSSPSDDTNGGAGIAGSTLTARLSSDGNTLTIEGESIVLYRVSGQR